MFAMSTAEKIETIMLSRKSGALGTFAAVDGPAYRIEADGITVTVKGHRCGWSVAHKGFEAIDSELIEAARNALDA